MSHARFVIDARWLVSASAVFALHLALFYGLTNGLRHSLTPFDLGPVEARLLDEPAIEPAEPPPPPPRIPAWRVDTVPLPEIAIDLPAELADCGAGEVKLLKSSGYPRLDAAALDHVLRAWRFVAARSDGEAVATWGPFAVTFMITR